MRLVIYRVAVPGWRAGLNRYPNAVIGVFVVLDSRCLSFVWRKP